MTTLADRPYAEALSAPAPMAPPHSAEPPAPDGEEVPRNVSARTIDGTSSIVGGALAGLAFTWVIYEHILGWSGAVGFVVCTWLVILVFTVVVSRIGNPWPIVTDRLSAIVICSGAALIVAAVFSVAGYIALKGWPAIHHLNFFTQDMSTTRPTDPLTRGGIKHAIVGTAVQVGIATAISLPLGVGTAVYLTEVGGRFAAPVRTVVEAMTALPDILAGLFVYTVLIISFHFEKTGLLVSLSLAVTMIPVIARSAEVVLRVVPGGLREASLALGASRFQTVMRVVLPTAKAGLATSLILGIARIAGETAPLLIVSGASNFFNADPLHNPMNSLPLYIFTAVRSGQPLFIQRGYGAALFLLILVTALFVTARFIARDRLARSQGKGRTQRGIATAGAASASSAPSTETA